MPSDAPQPTDWRSLLVRYMAHVGYATGSFLVPRTSPQFSEEEIALLEQVEEEAERA